MSSGVAQERRVFCWLLYALTHIALDPYVAIMANASTDRWRQRHFLDLCPSLPTKPPLAPHHGTHQPLHHSTTTHTIYPTGYATAYACVRRNHTYLVLLLTAWAPTPRSAPQLSSAVDGDGDGLMAMA